MFICLYNYQQYFNFQKTLFTHRLYWDKQVDDCIVRQTNTHFQYGYEYLGNSGRLVITPLTDRFFLFVYYFVVISYLPIISTATGFVLEV